MFKVPTTFRFHDGSESQVIDPLIGSIEGIADTPAYRGLALAVFENLELVEFGNRLPFLTFEILGDEQPTIAEILRDASDGLVECNEQRTVVGYAAHGPSIKAAIAPLVDALATPLWDDGKQVRTPMVDIVDIDADRELGASADGDAFRDERSQRPASELPTTLRLTYYDPARDYQFGEARASVGDEVRAEAQRDLPAVITANDAKALAQSLVARAWAERDRLLVRLPTRHLAIEPGSVLRLPFDPADWLVDRCTIEGFACVLELRPSLVAPPASLAVFSADSGRMPAPEPEVGETTVALFEVPAEWDQMNERAVLLAASSTGRGWKSQQVGLEAGAHRFAERTARRKSVLGRALTGLGPEDRSFEVELVDRDQWLLSRDAEAMAGGANLAILGREIIQFGRAVPTGPGSFRLSELVRGRAGTDATALHEAGELFVVLDRDAVRRIAIPGWVPASTIIAKLGRGDERTGGEAVLKLERKGRKAI